MSDPDTTLLLHAESAAKRKLGLPDPSWRIFKWENLGAVGVLVHLKRTRPKVTGKNIGKTLYYGPPESAVIAKGEQMAERARLERITGRCGDCNGMGMVMAGWSEAEGHKHRACERCNGTGEKP